MRISVAVFAVLVSIASNSQVRAASFEQLVAFGSSDLDVGNLGRFTNGPVWAEYLASDLNLPTPTASSSGGTVFAWGGARTGLGIDSGFPTVGKQIEDYLNDHVPDVSDLIIVTGGWNDIVFNKSRPLETIVSNMSDHISTLAAAGGRHFLIPSLVPLGFSPGSEQVGVPEEFNQSAATLNELMLPELDNLESELGIAVYRADFFGEIQSVVADPSAFGLENATDSAGENATKGATYLYWDDAHFTTAGHRILADRALAAVPQGDPFDFDGDGALGIGDIDALSAAIGGNNTSFDVNGDGAVNSGDLQFFVTDASKLNTWMGDANLNREFNSGDLVAVFTAGEYEDTIEDNSGWATGDWNGDSEFDTSDLVVAFQDGGYEQGPRDTVNAVPEPASVIMLMAGLIGIAIRWRHVRE